MSSCCVAFGCSNRKIAKGKSFHRFPKDEARRNQWIVALRRENFKPSEYSRICSDHFEEACFDRTGQTIRLRDTAVPTIFNFPPHTQKERRSQKAPAKRLSEDFTQERPAFQQDAPAPAHSSSSQVPGMHTEHSYHVTSPNKMKRKLDETESVLEQYQKTIKRQQTTNQRLKRRVRSLTEVVNSLKKQALNS